MVAELVEPIPSLESVESIEPKRRGRKPKLNPDGSRVNPPRVGKPPKASKSKRATPPRRGPKSLRPEIGAFLTLVNSAVLMSPLGTKPMAAAFDATIPADKIGDELDTAEIDALAGALDAQCQRSPRFRRYVERMLTAGAGGQLVTVLGIIVARRASRHGVLPPPVDPMLGMMLAGGQLDGNMTPPKANEPDTTLTGEWTPDRDAEAADTAPFDFEKIGTFAEPG